MIEASLDACRHLAARESDAVRARRAKAVAGILLFGLRTAAFLSATFRRCGEKELPAALRRVKRRSPDRAPMQHPKAHALLGASLESAVGLVRDGVEHATLELVGRDEARGVPRRAVELDAGIESRVRRQVPYRPAVALQEVVAAVGPPAVLAHGAKAKDAARRVVIEPGEHGALETSVRS